MKFKLLSIGQKFKFKNEVYIKTSPLVASNIETGQNKLIPRYSTLILLDDSGTNEQQLKKEEVNAQETLNAFNLFYEKCITALEQKDILIPEIKDELDKARDEFIQQLI